MMAHPALFTHPRPQIAAIIGNDTGILSEIVKHTTIDRVDAIENNGEINKVFSQYFPVLNTLRDPRVHQIKDADIWLQQAPAETYDIIVLPLATDSLSTYFPLLRSNGILVQPCSSPWLNPLSIHSLFKTAQQTGFDDCQLFHFPQPSFPSGWRFGYMATKQSASRRIREKDIYNRPFKTRYYNFDMHKAALALPEFLLGEIYA